MTTGTFHKNYKQIYIEAYSDVILLGNAIKPFVEKKLTGPEVSIIGKVSQFCNDKNIEGTELDKILRIYGENALRPNSDFGIFENPEIGNFFVVGALVSTFLYKLEGKTLGMLWAGPYGILRGMGASEIQVIEHLKMLHSGNYLLTLRGNEADLESYKKLLEENKD